MLFGFFALPGDPEGWRKKGYWDLADRELRRFNQKLIALPSASSQGGLLSDHAEEAARRGRQAALEGRKIRGNKYYEPIVVPLGGSLVNLPGGEVYSSLEKGVVDGAAWPVAGPGSDEVPGSGEVYDAAALRHVAVQHRDEPRQVQSASKEDQALLLKVGRDVGKARPRTSTRSRTDLAALKAAGVQETMLDPTLFKKVNAGLRAGVWATARTTPKTVAQVEAFYKLAKKNGDAE